MNPSEKAVDDKYKAEGWYSFSNGWPDRAYARIMDGELEVRFVEIKSPRDNLTTDQELMHAIFRSQGLRVEIEPASKTPKCQALPFDMMLKMLKVLEEKRRISN